MRSLFPHFSHSTSTGGELILHGTDLHLLIERSLSHEVLLVDLAHWLCSKESRYLWLTLPLPPINIEIFSFDLVILVRFFLFLKGNPLFINFSLRKNAGFDKNLLLPLGLQVHLDSVVSLLGIFTLLFGAVVRITQFLFYFSIELKGRLLLFRTEYPLRHLAECSSPLVGKKIVIHEHFNILAFLDSSTFSSNLYLTIFPDNTVLLFQKLRSELLLFLLLQELTLNLLISGEMKTLRSFSKAATVYSLFFLLPFSNYHQFRLYSIFCGIFISLLVSKLVLILCILLSPRLHLIFYLCDFCNIFGTQRLIFEESA